METVIKRDGRRVPFERSKIENAIIKAMARVNNCNTDLACKIASEIEGLKSEASVEEIQNLVERKLMASNCKDAAKEYIIYRNNRTLEREKNNKIIKKVWKRIKATDIENSNANVDENSFSGREKEASSDVQKQIALDYVASKDVAEGHKNGLIYLHDLEKYNLGMHNCAQIDFEHLFKNGFKTRNGDVRPPTSFSTACQLVAVIFQCQSQVQFGGVSSIHIDHDLAPFVKMSFAKHFKDGLQWVEHESQEEIDCIPKSLDIDDEYAKSRKGAYDYAICMLEKEGRQAAQGLYHNLNTLESRQGSQVKKVA